MSRRRWNDDAGNVTVAGAAVILAVVVLALLIGSGVTGMVQSHRATHAADMTALSAASVMQRASVADACAVARGIAEDNGARLTSCDLVSGDDTAHGPPGLEGISVTVSVAGKTASAAAGPVG